LNLFGQARQTEGDRKFHCAAKAGAGFFRIPRVLVRDTEGLQDAGCLPVRDLGRLPQMPDTLGKAAALDISAAY
jgi:hypothetical protein